MSAKGPFRQVASGCQGRPPPGLWASPNRVDHCVSPFKEMVWQDGIVSETSEKPNPRRRRALGHLHIAPITDLTRRLLAPRVRLASSSPGRRG